MPSVVQIELQVDANGAVSGFRTLNTAGAQLKTTLQGIGATGTQAGAALEAELKANTAATLQLTAALSTMSTHGQQAFRTVGSHALTELDSVRLFRDEFGIHIPRSMEKTMAQSRLVMTGLNAMQGAMIALGSIGVIAALGKEFYDLYKEIREGDDEIKKFDRSLSEMAQKKFFDQAQFSMARSQFAAMDKELTELDKKHSNSMTWQQRAGAILTMDPLHPTDNLTSPGKNPFTANTMSDDEIKRRNTDRELANTEPVKREDERHNAVMAHLDAESKAASAMRTGEARNQREFAIAQAKADEDHLNRVNQQNAQIRISNGNRKPGDQGYVPLLDKNAPDPERDNAMLAARAEMSSKSIQFSREEHDEIVRLQNEANNAGLRGYRLLMAQKEQALKEFEVKYGQSEAARAAITKRFDEENFQRVEEQTREIDRRHRDAQGAGLTGVPAIQFRERAEVADVNANLQDGRYAGNQEEAANAAERDRQDAHTRANAEILKAQQSFTDQINALVDSSTAHQLQGFARIGADATRQLDELEKKYEEVYGKPDTPLYQANIGQLNRGKSAISAQSNSETADLARKNAQETEKIEEEAARAGMPQMQAREQEIRDQYTDRVRAYQQMLADQEISQTDFNARVLAAGKEMQGELAAEARQERDKLAAEIEPFFRHPLEALEKIGEQQASQLAASLVQRTTGGRGLNLMPSRRGGGLMDTLQGNPAATATSAPGATSFWGHHHAQTAQPGATPLATSSAEAAHAIATMTVTAGTVIVQGGGGGGGSYASMDAQSAAASGPSPASAGGRAGSMPMTVRHADGSTSVIAVSSPAGGASSSSSASVPNFGYPNLAPGAPSSTATSGGGFDAGSAGAFGALPGASDSDIPGAAGGWSDTTQRAAALISTGSNVAGPSVANRIGGGLSDARQAVGVGQNLSKMFSQSGKAASSVGADAGALGSDPTAGISLDGTDGLGIPGSDATAGISLGGSDGAATFGGGGSGLSTALGTAGSAIGGAAALFGAGESNGGVGGALQGAMGGMQIGAMVGGPVGAAVGAAAGAILGFIGIGGRARAEQYYQNTVRPRIASDVMGFGMGSEDYQTAYNDLISLDKQARDDMKKFGMGGKSIWDNKVHPDITNAMQQLTREQKSGRNQYGMNAAEFHGGGLVNGFGDMATGPDTGWAHLQTGETVMHQSATAMHGDALGLILAGANRQQMAGYYGAQAMAPSYRATMQQAAFGGGGGQTINNGHTYHINAIDTQSFDQALMNSKHGVRAATNASYAENSGGSDFNG